MEIPKIDTTPGKLISESLEEYAEALEAYFIEMDKKLKDLIKEEQVEPTN